MKSKLQLLVNHFALQSFRDTADRDYVHARLAYRARLVPQFLWSSLHALDKYVKCVLLLNRVSSKKLGHTVLPGLDRLRQLGKFEVPLSPNIRKFVERLEEGARFRYFEMSYDNQEFDIVRLDRAVWEIRRYCQPLDWDAEIDGQIQNMLDMNLRHVREELKNNTKGTCVEHGWLEKVIADAKHHARDALIWNNLTFGPSRRRSVRLLPYWEAGNAPLYNYPEILDEIVKFVDFPNGVEAAWRAYLDSKKAEADSGCHSL